MSKGFNEHPDISAENSKTVDYGSDKEICLCDYSCEALHIWHFNPK